MENERETAAETPQPEEERIETITGKEPVDATAEEMPTEAISEEEPVETIPEEAPTEAITGEAVTDGKKKNAEKRSMRRFIGRDTLEWTGTAAFGAAVMLLGALLATSVKAGLTGADLLLTPLHIVSYDIRLGILLLYWALATFLAPRRGCRWLVLPAALDLGMVLYEFGDSAVMLFALIYANVTKNPNAYILNRNYFEPLVLGKALPTLLHVILLIGLIVALLGGMKHRRPHLVICIGYAAVYAVLAVIGLTRAATRQDLCIMLMNDMSSLLRFVIYGLPVACSCRVEKAALTETRLTDALLYLEKHRKKKENGQAQEQVQVPKQEQEPEQEHKQEEEKEGDTL